MDLILELPWLPLSVLIGFLFIVMFFVIALSSNRAGLSITTVASKMSVVFPITFSILIGPDDRLTPVKLLAIAATLTGVLLTVYQSDKSKRQKGRMIIPLLLFIGMGVVDSLVKYAQHAYVDNGERALFSAVLFMMAFITGLLFIPLRAKHVRGFRNWRVWVWGLTLGIFNFGSIFFMVSALNHVRPTGEGIDSSIIFGSNNIGIVTLSVLIGFAVFRERLRPVNWIGILISLIAIVLFSIS
jgi:drug/metabolite transporter (DMT)-like permease